MKKTWLLLITLTIGSSALSKPWVTGERIAALENQDHQPIVKDLYQLNALSIEQQLKAYASVKQIWLRKRLIEQLASQPRLSEQQRQWLISQVTSEHVLTTQLPDAGHESAISIVNISAMARGTLAQFDAIELAETWQLAVQQKQFDWATLLNQLSTVPRKNLALTLFITKLSEGELNTQVERLLASSDVAPGNLLLSILAEHTTENYQQYRLYQRIWSNTADEHSIRSVQNIIRGTDTQNNIDLLKQAARNKELTSLAFNLLAKHYGDEKAVRSFLFHQLSDAKHSSLAAVALARIDSPEVVSQLNQTQHSPDKHLAKASRLALSLSRSKE